MPAWIGTLNFVSARLRRAVLVLLGVAAIQAVPGVIAADGAGADVRSDALTLRRAID